MAEKKEHLQKLYSLVNQVANEPGNEWLKNELATNFGKTGNQTGTFSELPAIKSDTEIIRSHLSISGNYSINYNFIKNDIVRNQLYKDNLRMENCKFEISKKSELERFYEFCVNVFYQVEQLLNFFYGTKYLSIESFLTHLENISNDKFKFQRKNEKTISDVVIATKIFAFNILYFTDREDKTGINIDAIRKVRNEGSHRCEVIKKDINENRQIHNFFKYNTFETTHLILSKFKDKIAEELSKIENY